MKSSSGSNINGSYNTPFNRLSSKLNDQSFDSYVLIGKSGDNLNVISSESQEGASSFINKHQSSLTQQSSREPTTA